MHMFCAPLSILNLFFKRCLFLHFWNCVHAERLYLCLKTCRWIQRQDVYSERLTVLCAIYVGKVLDSYDIFIETVRQANISKC